MDSREERIQNGIQFLKNIESKNIPNEDKKKYLEQKMNEDEIAECFKRYAEAQKSGQINSSPSTSPRRKPDSALNRL